MERAVDFFYVIDTKNRIKNTFIPIYKDIN